MINQSAVTYEVRQIFPVGECREAHHKGGQADQRASGRVATTMLKWLRLAARFLADNQYSSTLFQDFCPDRYNSIGCAGGLPGVRPVVTHFASASTSRTHP